MLCFLNSQLPKYWERLKNGYNTCLQSVGQRKKASEEMGLQIVLVLLRPLCSMRMFLPPDFTGSQAMLLRDLFLQNTGQTMQRAKHSN